MTCSVKIGVKQVLGVYKIIDISPELAVLGTRPPSKP